MLQNAVQVSLSSFMTWLLEVLPMIVLFDRVILTLDRYFEGELSKEQALGLLMYEKPNIQFCIRSQQMLDECLKYIESVKL